MKIRFDKDPSPTRMVTRNQGESWQAFFERIIEARKHSGDTDITFEFDFSPIDTLHVEMGLVQVTKNMTAQDLDRICRRDQGESLGGV
jgi:hypothetical protein